MTVYVLFTCIKPAKQGWCLCMFYSLWHKLQCRADICFGRCNKNTSSESSLTASMSVNNVGIGIGMGFWGDKAHDIEEMS